MSENTKRTQGSEAAYKEEQAFIKFMEELMSNVLGQRPDFKNIRFSGSVNSSEGDGYAVHKEGGGDAVEEGWDGCSNCKGCPVDPLAETESGGSIDVEEGCCEDYCGEAAASITFSIRGPDCFVDEVASDVHRLLKDLRSDALAYAENVFEEDAEDAVSVLVSFSTSTR